MHIVRHTFVHHFKKKRNVLFCYWRHFKKRVYTVDENDIKVSFFYSDGHENTIKVLINLHVPFFKTCHTVEEKGKI